ncbi:peptidase M22 [Alicyclobacillus sp.]|uniref:peptidase M22 n=1 Tax=Alicyclobacillus sp. TaxID=61169 RepID=UPI0025C02A36|nr:peptidase M22 [Alicyclobacillus sp.]MCL6516201.1 peptidase M22 [Alicyclobacillus sp.]
MLILGIDTSNYTTSLCALRADDLTVVADARRVLPVRPGERGLRQSDALFFHVQHLPIVMDELVCQVRARGEGVSWRAVGVSVRPRPQARSYMPVFRAGQSFAHAFARALGLPVVHCSHQEGHLAAACHFLPPMDGPFLAVHLSGGTSDLLFAQRTRFGYRVRPLLEGADLHAGQFVDRVGVALGLPFPAGPALERLAREASPDCAFRVPSSRPEAGLSFSGPCAAALRAIEAGVPGPHVALAVQVCIANTVAKCVIPHANALGARRLVVAGGVAANADIQARVRRRLAQACPDLEVHFAPARYASDNALGPARIARDHLLGIR